MIERTANIVSEDGIVKLTSKEWGGIIFRIQRSKISSNILDSDKLDDCSGIYILLGKGKIRVGKGDIYSRVSSHKNSNDPKRNFFDYAIIITSPVSGLDDTQQGYIEHCWITRLKELGRYEVTNDVIPICPSNIREHDRVSSDKFMTSAEKFIHDICNEPIFEKNGKEQKTTSRKKPSLLGVATPKTERIPVDGIFTCKNSYCEATGIYMGSEGMKVLKGSKARLNPTPSFAGGYGEKARNRLIEEKKIVSDGNHFVFPEDVMFRSPSEASTIITGNSSNGLVDWKRDGKFLKEFLNR